MQIIKLNATDYSLKGKILPYETDIKIVCDSSTSGFSVTLPDLKGFDKELSFYNIPETEPGNDITISTVTGQIININEFYTTLSPFENCTLISDKVKRWVTDYDVISTKYTADSITLSSGTSSGTVEDLKTAFDGNIYHVDEVAATPGQNLIIDFVNVSSFRRVTVLFNYVGSSTHTITVQLYNWTTEDWDSFTSALGIEQTIVDHSFNVENYRNYIGTDANKGRVRVRLYHSQSGNTSHDGYIDEIALYR